MIVWGRWGLGVLLCAAGCGDDSAASMASTGGTPATTTGVETGSSSSGDETSSSGAVTTGASSSSGQGTDTSESSGEDSCSSSTGTSGESSAGGDTGLGTLLGDCGVLDLAALSGDEPGFIVNTIDFGELGFDYELLTPGGQAVFDAGNLGGSSLFSEVIAFDVLARCESAELLKTETEIEYDGEGTRTDLLVEFDGTKIGVSVTRGQGFPLEDPYSVKQAQVLLEDKLSDIPLSTANVAPEDAWEKQILHILAYGPMHAQSLQTAYEALGPEFTLDTIVVVTVTDGEDLFIYTE